MKSNHCNNLLKPSWAWWLTFVIPATQEAEIGGGSRFKANLGKRVRKSPISTTTIKKVGHGGLCL
jgi:hypothetical protein